MAWEQSRFILESTYLTPNSQRWLLRNRGGCVVVLQIFEEACNLTDDQGEILALVSSAVGRGPFAIVVPLPSDGASFSDLVAEGAMVTVQDDSLTVTGAKPYSELVIGTSRATLWSPRPNWNSLQAGRLAAGLSYLRARLEGGPGLARLVNGVAAEGAANGTLLQLAAAGWAVLAAGLVSGDDAGCLAGARSLAGLGPGLTPAGDDFLMGVFYGLWAVRVPTVSKALIGQMAEAAGQETSRLSAAWLAAASRGEATDPWHDLVSGLASLDERRVSAATGRVLAHGHSSGADALAGFVMTLVLFLPALIDM